MLALLLLSSIPSVAAADTYLSGTLVFTTDCELDGSAPLRESSDPNSELSVRSKNAAGSVTDGLSSACTLTVDGKAFTGPPQKGVKPTAKVTYGKAGAPKSGTAADFLLEAASGGTEATGVGSGEVGEADSGSQRKLSELNADARAFMATNLSSPAQGVDHRVVILPDGTTYPEQLPADVDENDTVEFDVIYPEGGQATLTPTCGDVAGQVRVLDKYETVSGMIKVESAETTPAPVTLTHYSTKVRCGTKMTVKVAISAPGFDSAESEISLDIDNLYRFSWGLGLGFDTGSPVSGVELDTATSTDDTGAEVTSEYVGGVEQTTGPTALVLLNVHLAPYSKTFSNLKERPWSALAITGGVDPTRLTKGGMLGLTFIPVPGLGITAGPSYFASEQATDGGGTEYPLGSAWTSDRDLQVVSAWDRQSLGVWVGLNLTGALRESLASSSSGDATTE